MSRIRNDSATNFVDEDEGTYVRAFLNPAFRNSRRVGTPITNEETGRGRVCYETRAVPGGTRKLCHRFPGTDVPRYELARLTALNPVLCPTR